MFTNQEGKEMQNPTAAIETEFNIVAAKRYAAELGKSTSEWSNAEDKALRSMGAPQVDDLLALAYEKQDQIEHLIGILERIKRASK